MLSRRTFTAGLGGWAIAKASALEDDSALNELLRQRIIVERRSIGMAVCIVTPHRQRIITAGRERLESGTSVSHKTLFEIASVTKIFTALLLADMALQGELGLDDPVSRHLPGDFPIPELDGRPITLADLATHTSGLPAFPTFPGDPEPWPFNAAYAAAVARFGLDEFKAWLGDYRLRQKPGTVWAYGNTDYALLGMALAHRGGSSFETLLQRRVLAPLELNDTIFRPAKTSLHIAESHDQTLKPTMPMDMGLFAPAGGLRSTPADMARFATAVSHGSNARIMQVADLLLSVRRPASPIGGIQALGWEIHDAPGGVYVSKDGVSWGQAATMVFDPRTRLNVLVFSNAAPDMKFATFSGGGVGAADLARHLVRPRIPLGGLDGARY